METKTANKTALTIFLAILCNVLWGSAHPFIKLGYAHLEITTLPQIILFAGIRFIIAGIILTLFVGIKRKKLAPPQKKNMPWVVLLALTYTTLQYLFFYIGVSNTSGTNSTIVNTMTTFIAVIFAHFVYKNEKMTLKKVGGTAIGFAGVLVATLVGSSAQVSFMGEGCIVIAAVFFVIGSMLSKKVSREEDNTVVTMYNMIIGGAVLTAIGLLLGGTIPAVNLTGILCLVYLSLLSAVAFSVWAKLLTYNPVSKISVYNFIVPIAGVFLSGILLGENILQVKYLLSLALVSVGIIIVNKSK